MTAHIASSRPLHFQPRLQQLLPPHRGCALPPWLGQAPHPRPLESGTPLLHHLSRLRFCFMGALIGPRSPFLRTQVLPELGPHLSTPSCTLTHCLGQCQALSTYPGYGCWPHPCIGAVAQPELQIRKLRFKMHHQSPLAMSPTPVPCPPHMLRPKRLPETPLHVRTCYWIEVTRAVRRAALPATGVAPGQLLLLLRGLTYPSAKWGQSHTHTPRISEEDECDYFTFKARTTLDVRRGLKINRSVHLPSFVLSS